jgi:3-methyladenine DNA glycosylase AlkC
MRLRTTPRVDKGMPSCSHRTMAKHPAHRFRAPSSMGKGVPLKDLFDRHAVALLAESFAAAHAGFASRPFTRQALAGLDALELMPRANHLATALAAHLPAHPAEATRILIAAMGPELTTTARYGLAVFFYLPHVRFIQHRLVDHFALGMQANYEVTKRFSAEFSIRPFLLRHPRASLALLRRWARDANPHVRRLVSEGTRPRLPWAERLKPFQEDPAPTLALLELLKDDPELYVRRSVANHLGDIAKDHPRVALAVCRRWLEEVAGKDGERATNRRWLIRHAVRLPAQQGEAAAVKLRKDAGGR